MVEAQPDVLAAMHSVKFPKVVRRSIHLTPFGEDFCRTCLVDEDPDSGRRSRRTACRPSRLGRAAVVGVAETRQRIR